MYIYNIYEYIVYIHIQSCAFCDHGRREYMYSVVCNIDLLGGYRTVVCPRPTTSSVPTSWRRVTPYAACICPSSAGRDIYIYIYHSFCIYFLMMVQIGEVKATIRFLCCPNLFLSHFLSYSL